MKIIVDVMGGDNAPEILAEGALKAAYELSVSLILVGDEKAIKKAIENSKYGSVDVTVVNADKVLTMEDDPMSVVRANRDSSMGVAFDLLRDGKGDAMISSGNSGALLCGSTLIIKRINGIKRPALASSVPIGRKLLIDSGANVETKPEYFLQFGLMGSIYAELMYGIKSPKVAILNNGTEEHKGTPVHKEAYALLKQSNLNFIGNIEGRDLYKDCSDVVVCDGFSGNIALKTMEGSGKFIKGILKDMFGGGLFSAIAYLLVKKRVAKLRTQLDYRVCGGAPFLGVNKTVVKAHGNANEKTIYYTVKQVYKLVENDVIGEICRRLEKGADTDAN